MDVCVYVCQSKIGFFVETSAIPLFFVVTIIQKTKKKKTLIDTHTKPLSETMFCFMDVLAVPSKYRLALG